MATPNPPIWHPYIKLSNAKYRHNFFPHDQPTIDINNIIAGQYQN